MGKKSSPPPAPDYAALAEQTAKSQNEQLKWQTNANRPNQNNPWGSVSWSQDPQGNWTQNVTLNPAEQAQLDANRGIQKGLTDTAGTLLGQAQRSLSTPLSTEGLPDWALPDRGQLSRSGNVDNLQTGGIQRNFGGYNGINGQGYGQGYGQLPAAGDASQIQQGAQTQLPYAGGVQRGFDSGGQIQKNLGDYGQVGGQVGRQQLQTQLGDAGQLSRLEGNGAGSYGQQGRLSGDYGQQGKIQGGDYGGGNINAGLLGGFGKLDYSNQSQLNPGFGAVKEVQDAMNALNAPGRKQARDAEIQRLKSQGITEDSPAWTRAMQRLETGDMEAANRSLLAAAGEYGNVFNRGLNYNQQLAGLSQSQADLADRQRGMGLQEQMAQGQYDENRAGRRMQSDFAGAQLDSQNQNARFNQGLMGANFADQQRLQNMQMDQSNAGFNNQVQQQQFNQNLASGQFGNAAMQGQFGMDVTNQQLGNQGQQQRFSQGLAAGQFGNQAQQQQYNQNQGLAQFGNDAQQQQFGQNLQAGQFANQGYDQRFNQGLQTQQFQNQLRQQGQSEQQQGYNQAMGRAQFGNQAQQQGFNQSLASEQLAQQLRSAGMDEQSTYANLSGDMRGRMLNERQTLRQAPLNDLNSLRGTNPSNPNFQNFNAAGMGQGVDYLGAGNQQYQSAMDAYNAKQARNSGMMSGLFGLGSAALGAPGFWGP